MKLRGFTTIAALVAGSLFAVAPAPAERKVEVHRTVTTTTTTNRYDADRRYHGRHHKQRVCRSRWVNHHRVTRCWWR